MQKIISRNLYHRSALLNQSATSEVADWLSKAERWYKFLDIIFGNREEMHVLVEDYDISKLIEKIRPKPKDILYMSAIEFQSIQEMARIKGQSDRNILKMKTKMMTNLHIDLCERLIKRIKNGGAITPNQRRLLERYLLNEYEKSVAGKGKNYAIQIYKRVVDKIR